MTNQLLLICYISFILKFTNPSKTCFEESNHINYLFLNTMSQIKIPLIPLDCLLCQSAYQVSIYIYIRIRKRNVSIIKRTFPG